MLSTTKIDLAAQIVRDGGICAYPTESVFGLGCCPYNERAVERLLKIKNRSSAKGLILIAANIAQIKPLINFDILSSDDFIEICKTWPGPNTWIVPASDIAPALIMGDHDTIAIRVTAHPIASKLCELVGGPIVSTSANISTQPSAKTTQEVLNIFNNLDIVLDAKVGDLANPTTIRNAVTKNVIRA